MLVSGFVTAGGQSRRMGQNKALMNFQGRTLIEHSLASLQAVAQQVGIIADSLSLYEHLNVACYPDEWPGLGPLAGIATALHFAQHPYVVVLGCDMPFITKELLEILLTQAVGYQVCVPKDHTGQLQPLCAIYHKTCRPAIEQLINLGSYAPRQLFDKVATNIIDFTALAHLTKAAHLFDNINTQADFSRASTIF